MTCHDNHNIHLWYTGLKSDLIFGQIYRSGKTWWEGKVQHYQTWSKWHLYTCRNVPSSQWKPQCYKTQPQAHHFTGLCNFAWNLNRTRAHSLFPGIFKVWLWPRIPKVYIRAIMTCHTPYQIHTCGLSGAQRVLESVHMRLSKVADLFWHYLQDTL